MKNKYLALGDSIVEGYKLQGKSFVYYLQKGFDITNRGMDGLSANLLKYYRGNLEDFTHVIIHIGINDFLLGYDNDQVEKSITDLIDIIRESKVKKIIFLQPIIITEEAYKNNWCSKKDYQMIKDRLILYRKFLGSLAEEKDIQCIDLMKIDEINIFDNLIDGIHPNLQLSKAIGKYIRTKLLEED